jgi:hypothetical protein
MRHPCRSSSRRDIWRKLPLPSTVRSFDWVSWRPRLRRLPPHTPRRSPKNDTCSNRRVRFGQRVWWARCTRQHTPALRPRKRPEDRRGNNPGIPHSRDRPRTCPLGHHTPPLHTSGMHCRCTLVPRRRVRRCHPSHQPACPTSRWSKRRDETRTRQASLPTAGPPSAWSEDIPPIQGPLYIAVECIAERW